MTHNEQAPLAVGMARAAGGAILFALPMLLTMEMWSLGFSMDPWRLALLLILAVPLLIGLAFYSGFEHRITLLGATVDAFVAYAIGFCCAGLVLVLIGVVDVSMSFDEIVGKITLQAIPGALGAVLASSQMGPAKQGDTDNQRETDNQRDKANQGDPVQPDGRANQAEAELPAPASYIRFYFRELFLMIAGALFLAFNVAPTEEMVLISYKMSAWHVLALAALSLLAMHAFVYVVEFRGQEEIPQEHSGWSIFLRFTVVGYSLALAVSLYCLWTFGRTDGVGLTSIVFAMVVLGFPASLGAAAARLIL
jgi:putative integral membrane protein (TIGR02587 family)